MRNWGTSVIRRFVRLRRGGKARGLRIPGYVVVATVSGCRNT